MEIGKDNPLSNKLGPGLSDTDVSDAVSKSGYPLQTIVARLLRPEFGVVQEEWSYVDEDIGEYRSIDILAEKQLYEIKPDYHPKVRPGLSLLVECKKSDLPFVFFLSPSKPWVPQFPLFAGLAKEGVIITTDDDPSSWHFSVRDALGLGRSRFLWSEPDYCMSFSKCVRKGSSVVLSGEEPFHGLILPILKAMHHYQRTESPPKTAVFFDCSLTLGVGVLDAPMVGIRVSDQTSSALLLPWVRVVKHETLGTSDMLDRTRLFAIDIVHKDFFQKYLKEHVFSFAQEFAVLALRHQQVLASGEAFVSGMGKDGFNNLGQRLEARSVSATVSRSKSILRNISRLFSR